MIVSSIKSTVSSRIVKPITSVNLQARFGRRYKINFDEAYKAEYGADASVDDVWLQQIIGRHGHIYPFGGTTLAVSTNASGPVTGQLKAMACCRPWQDSDGDGMTLLFDVAHIHDVAKVIKARTTRVLTAERRAALIEAGRAYRLAGRRNRCSPLTTNE